MPTQVAQTLNAITVIFNITLLAIVLHLRLLLCFSPFTLDSSVSVGIACISMKGSLVHVCTYLSQGSLTDLFQKCSTTFSVGLPLRLCAYYVFILSVLYTVSVLILQGR